MDLSTKFYKRNRWIKRLFRQSIFQIKIENKSSKRMDKIWDYLIKEIHKWGFYKFGRWKHNNQK